MSALYLPWVGITILGFIFAGVTIYAAWKTSVWQEVQRIRNEADQ